MHIADVTKGMLGANGIVGAGGPLACGSGLMAKVKGTDQVTICFFGDGAAEQGTMHESMNLASIWKLPVIFAIENNGYGEFCGASYSVATENVADRAAGFNMPGVVVDGCDFFAVYDAAREAVTRARNGGGPTLLETKVPRYMGHFEGDAQAYRASDEVKKLREDRDCLKIFRSCVTAQSLLSDAELDAVDVEVAALIDAAVLKAESDPAPDPVRDLLTDVYTAYA